MGLQAFRRIQSGLEVVYGTAVPATAKWFGMLAMELADREIIQPEDEHGSLYGSFRSYTQKIGWGPAKYSLDGLGFDDLPFLLGMTIVGGVSPTIPGGGTNTRLWTYEIDPDAPNEPDSRTFEFGDNEFVREVSGVFGTDLEISASVDSIWKAGSTFVGRALEASTFTADLPEREIESVMAQFTSLYIDPSGGTIGATQIECALIDFSWKLPAHFFAARRMDGGLYLCKIGESKIKPTLSITIDVNSDSLDLLDAYVAEERQLVRVESVGSNIEGALDRFVRIDGAYKIIKPGAVGDKDSFNTMTLEFAAEYDPDAALYSSISVQNDLAILP